MQISNLHSRLPGSAPTRSVRVSALVNSARIRPKKQQLLEEISQLDRGASASVKDRNKVEELCKALERLNPIPAPLKDALINGKWELLYTTSESVLGSNRPTFLRPFGAIFQIIDTSNLRAKNQETCPLFFEVTADLTPMTKNKVQVQLDTFKILGLISLKAPSCARGCLTITYLDEELRISRGDKGNLFVMMMKDKKAKP